MNTGHLGAGQLENEYSTSPLSSVKEFLLYTYAAVTPFFVFSVFFTRDPLSLWILGVMIIVFLVELVSSGGRFWMDSTFILLALFIVAYLGRTLIIFLEEPTNSWMGKTPFDRALAIDLRLILAVASFFICMNLLGNAPRRVFITILKIQLIVGAVLSIIALLQYGAAAFFGQSEFLKFEPTNESYYGRGNFFRLGRHKVFRSASVFPEPSVLGFFLVQILAKAVFSWNKKTIIFPHFWIGSILLLVILGIFSNFSFTAVFSIAILLIIFTLIASFGLYRKVIMWVLLIFSMFILVVLMLPYSNIILDRISNIFALRDGSTLDRLFRAYTSFLVFLDYPLLGVGPGGYAFFYPRMGGIDKTLLATPLNIWLNILTDVGILGSIPFFIFLGLIIKKAFIKIKSEPLIEIYLWSIIAGLVSQTISVDFWFNEMFWFEYAILVCLIKKPP
jgi:hypothetical protein